MLYNLSSRELPNVMHSKFQTVYNYLTLLKKRLDHKHKFQSQIEEDNKTLHPIQKNELPPLADNFYYGWISIKIAQRHRGLGAGSINQENDENPIPTTDPPKDLNNDNDNEMSPWKFRSLKA